MNTWDLNGQVNYEGLRNHIRTSMILTTTTYEAVTLASLRDLALALVDKVEELRAGER